MTNEEIERYRRQLNDILSKKQNHDLETVKQMRSDLVSIAQKVGASAFPGGIAELTKLAEFTKENKLSDPKVRHDGYNAMITEVIYNINDALRTEAMINNSKTAYKSFIVSVIASIIAMLSTFAACISAVFVYVSMFL